MKKIHVVSGKEITIKEVAKKDAQNMIKYINNIAKESDFLTFGPREFNITIEREEQIIEDSSKSDNKLFIIAELDGEIIGNLNFAGGNRLRTKHVGEFGISVRKEYWGYGIGKELIAYLIEWAKGTGIVRKINLRVRSDNERGLKLYTKLGFVKEGLVTRDFYLDGQFYDSIQMGLKVD